MPRKRGRCNNYSCLLCGCVFSSHPLNTKSQPSQPFFSKPKRLAYPKPNVTFYRLSIYIHFISFFPYAYTPPVSLKNSLKVSANSSDQQLIFLRATGIVDSKFPKHPFPIPTLTQRCKHLSTY